MAASDLESISCVGCRHDEITPFMMEDLELNRFLCGISVRGGLILDHDKRTRAWWATTLRLTSAEDLARRVRTVRNVYDYLREVSDLQLLSKLHELATGQDTGIGDAGGEGRRAVEKAIRMGLIRASGSGHALAEKLGWIHGTLDDMGPYRMSMAEKMELLQRRGVLSQLEEKGLTEDQVRDFLYDNWHMADQAGHDSEEAGKDGQKR